jgi:hypothetical protein
VGGSNVADDERDELLPHRLVLEADLPGRMNVQLQPAWRAGYAAALRLPPAPHRPSAKLLSFDTALGAMAIFPMRTWPGAGFLKPKHPPFTEFVLDGWTQPLPQNVEDVGYILGDLPAGFIRDPAFGLGLDKEFLPILQAIRRLGGITSLVLRGDGPNGPEGTRFLITYDDFDDVRRAMHRVTNRYRAEAKADRTILAHNEILTELDPVRFPPASRVYGPGTVFKLLSRRSDASPLSRDDNRALIKTLTAAAPALAKTPDQLFALGQTVETVSLEVLITKLEAQLAKGGSEAQWQKLLDQNPFVLSLVFGYPIVHLASQGVIGGWRLKGGAKIADYVVKNQKTHAIALVELKTPDTPLLGREYRTGVFDVSPKLTGAVMQVLDQRLKLQKSLALIKDEEDDPQVRTAEAFGIDAIVVAGRTPGDRKAIRSFELFRGGLRDVRVFTFDELIAKTRALLEVLTASPDAPPPLKDEDLPF